MCLPNFIIGGAAQSGTTSLSSALVQHPDIYLPTPLVPECHYFYKPWEIEKGLEYYRRKWFSTVQEESAIGEKSTSYLFGGESIANRIARATPDIRLIFILRNPIERAWSNYKFTVFQGLEQLSFMEALLHEECRRSKAVGRWKIMAQFVICMHCDRIVSGFPLGSERWITSAFGSGFRVSTS